MEDIFSIQCVIGDNNNLGIGQDLMQIHGEQQMILRIIGNHGLVF